MKTNETTAMLSKRTPLPRNEWRVHEKCVVGKGSMRDKSRTGTERREERRGWILTGYVNNRKGLVFFVSHFRQPAPSERTRQSGTGRTSPVREISLENAQMRLANRRGGSAAARAFRSLSGNPSPFSMFSTMGMRGSELGSRTLQDSSTLNFSCGYLLILRVSARQSFILPSSFLNFSIIFFFIP